MSTPTVSLKKKHSSGGPALDWAAGHGPVTGALSATTGCLAVATTGAATGMPPAWALAIGSAGALGHTIACIRWRNTGRTLATRATSWLLGAGWTTWAIATGPLSWTALGSLATLGVGMATANHSANLWEEAREEEALATQRRAIARELSRERRAIAAEWVERVQRVTGVSLRVLAVEFWPTNTGFTIDAELPPGGVTYERIAREGIKLAADARLPHGCTVSVLPGIDQGRVLLDVTTANVLANETPYPADYSPLSITGGIPWGVRPSAEEVRAYLREQCALLVGPTGSGKTNMVHTILAGLARAEDVLTWVIDLNAGSAGLPWVRPTLDEDGQVRPGIDWLAGTTGEAERMLDAALRIAKHRKRAYQKLMAQADTDLLPISAKIPQIMLVIDEGAEILASNDRTQRELAKKILEVIRIARAMGIRTVLTALGATGSVLGNLLIRREAKVRAALTGGEVEGLDLGKLFPGSRGLSPAQAPFKGSGFMGTPESPVAPFKSWRILPSQIREIVHATSDRHPTLDAVSAQAAGEDYTQRWSKQRTAWMADTDPNDHTPEDSTQPPAISAPDKAGLNLKALREDTGDSSLSEADVLAQRLMAEIDAQFGTTNEPDHTTDDTEDGPRAPRLNLSALRDDTTGPTWLPYALAAIKAAGPAGMKPSAVADMVGRDRKTVRAALRAAAERGELIYRDNGPHSVYIHPDHA